MQRRVRVVDKNGNVKEEREFKVSDLSHLDAQLRFPHRVEQPKKGRASYTRKIKYKNNNYED